MANGVGSAAGRSKRDQMPKQIRLNAFDMNCGAQQHISFTQRVLDCRHGRNRAAQPA